MTHGWVSEWVSLPPARQNRELGTVNKLNAQGPDDSWLSLIWIKAGVGGDITPLVSIKKVVG